jgi:gamma-tubulin complex component 3
MSAEVPNPEGQESAHGQGDHAGLTLLRLGLWTGEIKLKMRLMAEVVDDAKSG